MATPYVTVITTETSSHTWSTDADVASAINSSAEADPLLAFEPEQARLGRVSGGPTISGRILYAGVCAVVLSYATACIGLVYLRPVQPPLPTVAAAASVAATDTAVVNSRPSGAEAWIDDRAPASPVTQPALDPPAATSAASPAGWIAVAAPIALTISERGRRLGVSTDGRLLLPAGSHELQLANDDLEFTTSVPVQVPRGQVVTVQVQVPNGRLSINAVPWAEAIIDGRLVGVTPIANLSLPIGLHDIVWRHPELGERRESVSLAARTPARVGIDLRR